MGFNEDDMMPGEPARQTGSDLAKCEQYKESALERMRDEAEAERDILRAALRDIKRAIVEGRVCEDVPWFDSKTTLYDFCDMFLPNEQPAIGSENRPETNSEPNPNQIPSR